MTTMPPLARNTLFALSAALTTACPAVPTRPQPPICSAAAIAAMDKLGITVGGDPTPIRVISHDPKGMGQEIELGTGPIASVVVHPESEGLVKDPDQTNHLPVGTRLFGRVLPSPGEEVLIRYTELQIPPGERVPICAIANGFYKERGSPSDEFTVPHNIAWVEWVHTFPK